MKDAREGLNQVVMISNSFCAVCQPYYKGCDIGLRSDNVQTSLAIIQTLHRHSGGYSSGVPPLPIPNREVKPVHADGTAQVGE